MAWDKSASGTEAPGATEVFILSDIALIASQCDYWRMCIEFTRTANSRYAGKRQPVQRSAEQENNKGGTAILLEKEQRRA
jgi:hypothetical protein